MRGWWAWAGLLAACSGSTDEPPADDTDDTAELPVETDTDVEPLEGAVLRGRVLDTSGSPITSGVRIQFCRQTVCLTPQEMEDGNFTFRGLDPGPGSFETVWLGSGTRYANAFVPLTILEDEDREQDVVVPVLGPERALPITPSALDLGGGLRLTLGQGALDRPAPFDDVPTAVAGVDATAHALPIEGVPGELLAMWYLWPFDAPTVDPDGDGPDPAPQIPVEFDDRWALESGDAELWIATYYTADWTKIGDLVDAGDVLTPEGGAGLPRLSTIIVVRKP